MGALDGRSSRLRCNGCLKLGQPWHLFNQSLNSHFLNSDGRSEMSVISSVQRAHDELLQAMPAGVNHDDCPFCADLTEKAEEVVQVADESKAVFTEDQHFALLTSAVERETSSLTEAKSALETEVASLKASNAEIAAAKTETENRVDVLEAEKAAEVARADAAEKALADFKAELAETAAVEARKAERVDVVKAADENLDESYFTDTRIQRWAEMSSEAFEALVSDLTEAAAASKKKIPAPQAKGPQTEGNGDEDETPTLKQTARETSAFTGGEAPGAPKGSTFGTFLKATGKLPVQN